LFAYIHSLVRDLNAAADLFQQVAMILGKKFAESNRHSRAAAKLWSAVTRHRFGFHLPFSTGHGGPQKKEAATSRRTPKRWGKRQHSTRQSCRADFIPPPQQV
jgi:hypothetical protein